MARLAQIKRFRSDEAGAVLVFWAIALSLSLILIAWAFDMGRVAATQSELQSYVDQVALAAAGELDGRADSITRAQAAADQLIADSQTFGAGSKALAGDTNYTIDFHATLPTSDRSALGAATTVPEDAVYARVTAVPQSVRFNFGAAYAMLTGGTRPPASVGAVAVAGFTQYACDITPLMFCLPNTGYKADAHVGDLLLLRSGGGNNLWQPGNFGFLDPANVKVDPNGPCAGLNGANLDRCLLGAQGSITQCFSIRGVDTDPGQSRGIEERAFNVRFDMYAGNMQSLKNDPAYAPAPNVIKGVIPQGSGSCIGNNSSPANTLPLPFDDCFASGGCTRFGDGNWSVGRSAYVAANYGGADPHATASTRYEYYLAEIARAGGAMSGNPILTGAGLDETGRPQCAPNPSPDPDRRVVVAAGIDCQRYPFSGRAMNVPVDEFFRLFMTRPVGVSPTSNSTFDLWVEVIGSAGGVGSGSSSTAGIFRDVVQLYR